MWTSLSERALPEAQVADPSEDADVVPLRRRSAQRWGTLAAAAAVVMVAGIAAVALWSRSADEAVVARQALERLGDAGQAEAVLVEVDEGFALDVSFDGVDPGEGYLEVWLINTEVTQLVSLGPVQSDGRYLLPDGLNPSAFPVVDISIEHFDGDPTHSGDSVFRGVLEL